ncbi:MAG: hypothetical protein P1V20_22055 [Verrucomicrobiales bacterium]|nr:hypothetical protein [Verrucomicrobiales bacterium]
MQTTIKTIGVFATLVIFMCYTTPVFSEPSSATMTTWTSIEGRIIQATMLRLDGDRVILQRKDGVVFSLPLSKLSADSQAAAKAGSKPIPAPKENKSPASPALNESQAVNMTAWISADGRSIQAKLIRLEGENVLLQRNDGTVFRVPLSKLSSDSQAAARIGNEALFGPKKRESNLVTAFELVGGWTKISGIPEDVAGDPSVIKVLNDSLVNEPFASGWPITVRQITNEVERARYIILKTAEEPGLDSLLGILGQPDSTEKENEVTWYLYGWCHFGISDGKVTRLRGDCKSISR